ncbi:MAG: type II toxin-antitoxin system VapC family toxin [Acidobacteria bacterium]|nr:type II toxin-antitoxin system VapC family toxin [Acidobacteriota bacterium]
MKTVLLDTGYVIALELASDQNHRAALKHWRSLTKSLPLIVTTSYVFDEIVTFFNSRRQHAKAVEIGSRLLSSPSIRLVHVGEDLFQQGWSYFQKHKDKEYSLTDCISFLVMKEFGLETALTFDRHFVQAGFKKLP